MCDCQNCQCDSESDNSGFIFGLLLGAIIGAVIAVIIYKNNKTEVFSNLKEKMEKYFRGFTQEEPPSKIPVVLPSKIIATDISPTNPISKPRKFIKPKK